MLTHRVIPCLLLSNGGFVKTIKFRDPKYVGDPINAVRIFNEKEVDELMVLDIDASKKGRGPDYAMVEQIACECFMPLCFGGGIKTLDDARRLFGLGVEKVCLQTQYLLDPTIIQQIAEQYGEQAVVVSIDVKRSFFGKPTLFSHARKETENWAWLRMLKTAVDLGAGEILLNAVDRDGTQKGMDLELIRQASEAISAPLIAVGGVGSLTDIKAAINNGASAVAVGAYFVFQGPHRAVLITYPRYEELQALWGN
jgi:cyclase